MLNYVLFAVQSCAIVRFVCCAEFYFTIFCVLMTVVLYYVLCSMKRCSMKRCSVVLYFVLCDVQRCAVLFVVCCAVLCCTIFFVCCSMFCALCRVVLYYVLCAGSVVQYYVLCAELCCTMYSVLCSVVQYYVLDAVQSCAVLLTMSRAVLGAALCCLLNGGDNCVRPGCNYYMGRNTRGRSTWGQTVLTRL